MNQPGPISFLAESPEPTPVPDPKDHQYDVYEHIGYPGDAREEDE